MILVPYDALADEPLVTRWLADPSIARWFPDADLGALAQATAFLIMPRPHTPAGLLAFAHVGLAGSAELCCVMVDPRWRGQELAGRAIVEGIGGLPEGVTGVVLRVHRENHSARRLYARLGFTNLSANDHELFLVRRR